MPFGERQAEKAHSMRVSEVCPGLEGCQHLNNSNRESWTKNAAGQGVGCGRIWSYLEETSPFLGRVLKENNSRQKARTVPEAGGNLTCEKKKRWQNNLGEGAREEDQARRKRASLGLRCLKIYITVSLKHVILLHRLEDNVPSITV